MEIVSGRVGRPHVTSQQFRQIIEGIVGDGSCILPSGENLEPELVSNNSLKIRSGMMCYHGNVSSVKIGTYDEVELTNGSQGMKRIDLVVNRYTRNEEDNTEKNEWIVIMGTPAESNPTVPEYTKGNLQEGDLVDDCPAFEVHFDGINITEVTKMLEIAQTNKNLSNKLTELNDKINNRKNNVLIGKWGKSWNLSTTPKNIGSSKPIVDDDCYKTTTGANATVTIKQSGLYCVTMYAQGSANQGASACIQAQVIANRTIVDDNYVLFGAQYSYNGFAANVNMSRIIYLENGTVLSPQIRKSDASGAAVTTGSSYMEVVKLA